jgi:hypothetical protein
MTDQAQEYWTVRKVLPLLRRLTKQISAAFTEIQRLQDQIRASEETGSDIDKLDLPSAPITELRNTTSSPPKSPSPGGTATSALRIPRKRLTNGDLSVGIEDRSRVNEPRRPQSPSLNPQSPRVEPPGASTPPVSNPPISFPKSNVIEPRLLWSYLSQPLALRPSILLLDVRPRERYEKGCINARQVVWIDPILVDEE